MGTSHPKFGKGLPNLGMSQPNKHDEVQMLQYMYKSDENGLAILNYFR